MPDTKELRRSFADHIRENGGEDGIEPTRLRIQLIFDLFYDDEEDQAIRDNLSDLIHLCAERGINFEEALSGALRMWTTEREEWGMDDLEEDPGE